MEPHRKNAFLTLLAFTSLVVFVFVPGLARPAPGMAETPLLYGSPTPIPATAEDLYLPGTQPNALNDPMEPVSNCAWCHSSYGQQHAEPYFNWKGSMMAQAARDPVFWAALAIANQDVQDVGSMCLRCHAPNAWLEGRSTPADGSALTETDYDGIQCHFCHRMVDHTNVMGDGIPRDAIIISNLEDVPPIFGSGMYVIDPDDERRGPWDLIAEGWHVPDCWPEESCGEGNPHRPLPWPWESEFHHESALCGVCHDLLNPMFNGDQINGYAPDPLGQANADPASGFPEQRTYTEWALSEYAMEEGVYAPQYSPNSPNDTDHVVNSCQSCHMPGAINAAAARERSKFPCFQPDNTPCPDMIIHDLVPVHDLTGANTWVPETIKIHPVFSATITTYDINALDDGMARAAEMLQKAATLTATLQGDSLSVRIINETGHKLPTGYPEGRQMWLAVTAYDEDDNVLYESGVYSETAATLLQDPDLQWFGTWQGLSEDWAAQLGVDPNTYHFHLALNNEVQFDNRIPPRGFDNAAFLAAGIAPVGATYADGQYWADVQYTVPAETRRVVVELKYQVASRGYIEFLRDANFTNDAGDILYDLWEQTGKSPPVVMARLEIPDVVWLPVIVR